MPLSAATTVALTTSQITPIPPSSTRPTVPIAAPIAISAIAGDRGHEAHDAEAGLAGDVLTPRLLEQHARPLERVDDADVLEHEDRDGEEGDEAPRETDQRAR